MVHVPENFQNTLVPYSAYNLSVQTKSDDLFVTILTNSEIHCATPHTLSYKYMSHPVLEGKPNANHVRARISYSRTQQLHNMDIITQCSK
jgi:hypothetical protein